MALRPLPFAPEQPAPARALRPSERGGRRAGARFERKPSWLKVRAPGGERYASLKRLVREHRLHTVCEEARCPNIGECWNEGTATVMLLGDACTRACRFCDVRTQKTPPPPDPEEPRETAEAVRALALRYVVLTMVDRDDLPDGGAAHVAQTVRAIRRESPATRVEVLTGDLAGDPEALLVVAASGADCLAHNIETVRRLQGEVRDRRCGYDRSLGVLRAYRALRPDAFVKSSVMLGLGERPEEVEATLGDLRRVGVDIVTLGQYLRPSAWHLPVEEYVSPARFDALADRARALGFHHCAAGPLVRSSYKAAEAFVLGARAVAGPPAAREREGARGLEARGGRARRAPGNETTPERAAGERTMGAIESGVNLDDVGLEPDVGLRRLLDDDGRPLGEVGIEDAVLARVLEQMVRLRVLDGRALNLQRQGRISFYAPCGGQEAAIVASTAALGPDDWCFPSYREVGALLCRGLTMRSTLDQLYGNAADLAKGRQMPNHFAAHHLKMVSISSCIATQIPQAAGLGMAQRMKGERAATLCYFGDGATSEGDFHAGLNFAGVYQAHTVFFCQNNQWAITCPVEQQTRSRSIAIKARAYGIGGVRIDGNDAAVVYQTVREALERAREGGGPTLIEALTYRMGPHSTSDDPRRYRAEDAAAPWQGRDPIERLERYLVSRGAILEDRRAELEATAQAEVSAAIEAAEASGAPAPQTLFTDILAEPPARLQRQAEELRDLMARGVVKPLRGFGLGRG